MGVPGYVYVLQNPAFPGVLKIGRTTRLPEERADELSRQTGVPAPYQVVFSEFFEDCHAAEKAVHEALAARRRKGEFFRVSIDEAVAAIEEYKRIEQRGTRTWAPATWARVALYLLVLIPTIAGIRSCLTSSRDIGLPRQEQEVRAPGRGIVSSQPVTRQVVVEMADPVERPSEVETDEGERAATRVVVTEFESAVVDDSAVEKQSQVPDGQESLPSAGEGSGPPFEVDSPVGEGGDDPLGSVQERVRRASNANQPKRGGPWSTLLAIRDRVKGFFGWSPEQEEQKAGEPVMQSHARPHELSEAAMEPPVPATPVSELTEGVEGEPASTVFFTESEAIIVGDYISRGGNEAEEASPPRAEESAASEEQQEEQREPLEVVDDDEEGLRFTVE